MKKPGLVTLVLVAVALTLSVMIMPLCAAPTTADQARAAVQGWRQLHRVPLGSPVGITVSEVKAYKNESGTVMYYVVYLRPSGFVIVSADDLIEPIVAFSPQGIYNPSKTNPLGALVENDLPARIKGALTTKVKLSTLGKSPPMTASQKKWVTLQGFISSNDYGAVTVSDIRVSPLVQSRWGQDNAARSYCYNYYTPNHYPAGCVATAMAQLMRFHQFPTSAVGTRSYTITVDGNSRSEALRGGNGSGSAYSWNDMMLIPDSTITDTQRQAIGTLMHDTGTTVETGYSSGNSGANILDAASALKNAFGYTNAVKGYNNGENIPTNNRNDMVNPNLDAGLPVLFGITGGNGGHAIVADGYGYDAGTLYHHLNMGWSGAENLWYNLPTIDDAYFGFTSIYRVVYNIYTSGAGEIISGRVIDSFDNALSDVRITATRDGATVATTTTNSNGIYALRGLSSAGTYTISATKNGYMFNSQTVTLGVCRT